MGKTDHGHQSISPGMIAEPSLELLLHILELKLPRLSTCIMWVTRLKTFDLRDYKLFCFKCTFLHQRNALLKTS